MQYLIEAEKKDHYLKLVNNSDINIKARIGCLYNLSKSSRVKPKVKGLNIIWMNSSADSGLPHTRYPNIICLPDNISNKYLYDIILHESVHVSQRLYPKKWNEIFKLWNMKPFYGTIPTELNNIIRINPDTVQEPFYIWKDKWVVMGIFKSIINPDMRNIKTIWWNYINGKILYTTPKKWLDFFGNISGEHPYEISAYYIASTKKYNNKAYKILFKFL